MEFLEPQLPQLFIGLLFGIGDSKRDKRSEGLESPSSTPRGEELYRGRVDFGGNKSLSVVGHYSALQCRVKMDGQRWITEAGKCMRENTDF